MFDASVLIVEDEPQIRRAIKRATLLSANRVIEAGTAQDALAFAAASAPDAVILDLSLPDGDGVEVCRELRQWSAVPIIVLADGNDSRDKVRLLDLGADDYITKPFDSDELGARLRVQLRRALSLSPKQSLSAERIGHLTVDVPGRTVRRHDRRPDRLVKLTRTEFDILALLVSNAGRTLTHRFIGERMRRHATPGSPQDVRAHVFNLRRKIETDARKPKLIVTESGVGYRFERPA
jgi:two-component system, OmpR family, KDP operon response regulator KdpE